MLAFAAVTASSAARAGWRPAPRPSPAPPAPAAGLGFATTIAIVGCAAVVAGWMVPTLGSLAGGMDRADTLWYHMPLSAKFVQTGSLGDIFFFDPIFFASFYPANSEVLHAVPILAFDRDIVSPVLNLGFLGIGLLASWCIGRPYGVAPQALIGGSIALGAQMLVEFQAGEALNDITGRRLHPRGGGAAGERLRARARGTRDGHRIAGRGAGVAGLAAGLAAGMKLSFLAPVAALTVGVVVLAPARAPAAGPGCCGPCRCSPPALYWYARNAIATGNPIPYVSSLGPIELPAPGAGFELRPGLLGLALPGPTSTSGGTGSSPGLERVASGTSGR